MVINDRGGWWVAEAEVEEPTIIVENGLASEAEEVTTIGAGPTPRDDGAIVAMAPFWLPPAPRRTPWRPLVLAGLAALLAIGAGVSAIRWPGARTFATAEPASGAAAGAHLAARPPAPSPAPPIVVQSFPFVPGNAATADCAPTEVRPQCAPAAPKPRLSAATEPSKRLGRWHRSPRSTRALSWSDPFASY